MIFKVFSNPCSLYDYYESLLHPDSLIVTPKETTNKKTTKSTPPEAPIYSLDILPSLINNNPLLAVSYLYYQLQHSTSTQTYIQCAILMHRIKILNSFLTLQLTQELFVVIQQLALLYTFPLQFYRQFILYMIKSITTMKDKTLTVLISVVSCLWF